MHLLFSSSDHKCWRRECLYGERCDLDWGSVMGSSMGRGHNAQSGHKRGGPVTRAGPAEMFRGRTSLQSRRLLLCAPGLGPRGCPLRRCCYFCFSLRWGESKRRGCWALQVALPAVPTLFCEPNGSAAGWGCPSVSSSFLRETVI